MIGQQTLTGLGNGKERRRTTRLHCECGTAQVEFIGNACCQEIQAVAHHRQVVANLIVASELLNKTRRGAQFGKKIGGHAHPGVNADRAGIVSGIVACVFKRLPAGFEHQAMLRVHQFRFTRIDSEKFRVEQIDVVEN